MKSFALFSVCVFLTVNSVFGDSCGGLLEGEQGHFSISHASSREQPDTLTSSCLWIIQLHYENNIRFTLNALDKAALLNLYPEDQLTSCSLNNYTKLNTTQIGSSFEFLGKTLIVVLPDSSASVSFSWHFIENEDKNSSVAIMKNSDYINSPSGVLEWAQLESVERVTWGINTNANFRIKWNVDLTTSCEANDNCNCFYFGIFRLTPAGVLSEAVRTCGQSLEGKIDGISGRVLVLVKVNTNVEANKVGVSWETDDGTVTEPPVTTSPVPTATGLFAATETGLVALNLQTLRATALTSVEALAMAVNQNLQKVYWSEIAGIMRSDFNGSDKEVVVSPIGNVVCALAVHEPSGNIYFSVDYSKEITVCNALGKNCAVVVSSSSLASRLWSIAFDYENNAMYWSIYGSGNSSIIRANLDGSSVTLISNEFSRSSCAIKLVELVLYWTDYSDNTVGTIDMNGTNKRTIVELEGHPGPEGIQVDSRKIYVGNWHGKTIQSVDRDSGQDLTTIFNSTGGIRHLALFSVPA